MECSNGSRWNVKKASSVCCISSDTQRNATHSIWQNAVLVISAALHESFVRIKHFHSVSQFLLYWMRIICCIYKLFVRPLKAFATVPLCVRVKLQIHFAQILCGVVAPDSRILGFDHLKWTCDGTFEGLLARGDREFKQ